MSLHGLGLFKIDPARAQLALRHRIKHDPEIHRQLEPGQRYSDHDSDLKMDLPKILFYLLSDLQKNGITGENITEDQVIYIKREIEKARVAYELKYGDMGDWDGHYNQNPFLPEYF